MREVTFVSGLKIESVLATGANEISYHVMSERPLFATDGSALALENMTVTSQVVPVHALRGLNWRDQSTTYIAYSKEVQKLLCLPFDAMAKQIEALESTASQLRQLHDKRLREIADSTLWQRLKYLFTRKI